MIINVTEKTLGSLFSKPILAKVLVLGAVKENETLDCFALKIILQSNKNNRTNKTRYRYLLVFSV